MGDQSIFGDRIGVMQGRLSPMVSDRIQAFPSEHWRVEFDRAAEIGLSSIEWIFETPMEGNPLWSASGLDQMREAMAATGVGVNFVCADIFMESPFVRMDDQTRSENRRILDHLIDQCAELGVTGIEIPCVDPSAIHNREEEEELLDAIAPCLDRAGEAGVAIGLETSLAPRPFADLLERCGHPVLRANYDTGNSASLGYDPLEEIRAYGRLINNVHIKDRVLGASTVPLGEGDARIPETLQALKDLDYGGEFILQAARKGDDCEAVAGYRTQVADWVGELK